METSRILEANSMEEKYQNYLDFVKDSRDYNNLLFSERKLRLPFIDAQTGVAQVDSSLWRSIYDRKRLTGSKEGGLHRHKSTVYQYPAMRWQKRRRDYLMKDNLPSYSDHSLLASRNVVPTTNTMQVSPTANHHSSSLQLYSSSSTYSSQQTSLMRSQASVPSRADSTGSHSCHTIDSDSRDLSIATSQSFDSPSRDDSPQLSLANGFHELGVPITRDTQQDLFQQNNNEERLYYSELTTSQQQQQLLPNVSSQTNNHATNKQLQDQTKAAIKLHSKMNKKKNIGQSLIKLSNSILVKSGATSNHSHRNQHHQNDTTNGIGNNQQQHVINYNAHNGPTSADTATFRSEFAPTTKSSVPQAIISNGSNRPFVCSICDQTYKTRPGLSYHFIHTHNTVLPKSLPSQKRINKGESNSNKKKKRRDGNITTIKDAEKVKFSRLTRSQFTNQPPDHGKEQSQQEIVTTSENKVSEGAEEKKVVQDHGTSSIGLSSFECHEKMEDVGEYLDEGFKKENGVDSGKKSRPSKQNPFCDFCLGTVDRNRRTRQPEQLISCTSCGSSGHPSCLRFTDNIKSSILKYDWQCIDCKTCSTCNNADNEDQLLFCDDCDRSYHTYCLSPPLVELPEGNWSCQLCLLEYHGKEPAKEMI